MTVVILVVVMAGLRIIAKWDEPLPSNGRTRWVILAGAFAEGSMIRHLTEGALWVDCLMLSLVGGCLLLASVTDMALCQVYNFTWWLALTAVLVLLRDVWETALWPLAFFCLLQFAVFRPLYGRADCYAFCICAAAEAAAGMKMSGFLTQMFLAWMFLFLIQAIRGNVDKKGNLKQPVPFLPYITISFWLTIAFGVVWK